MVVIYESMSLLDKMDTYLKDLDAIKNYERVKQQRDEAIKQCEEIKSKLKPVIENIVDVLGRPEPRRYSQDTLEIAGEQIIEKIDKSIKLEIEKRVDDDFRRRLELESNLRAEAKVKQVVDTEWPNYYRENIEPKVRELETKIKANALSVLKGP
jgi:membrane protein involved in colicin uptake